MAITTWFGAESLWASVPGLEYFGATRNDGEVWMKIGWWRLAEGPLTLTATRLDGDGHATADVPAGDGLTGFQATGLTFSAAGCWTVNGSIGDDSVSFVVQAGA